MLVAPLSQALNASKQQPLTAALVDGLELGPLLARGSFGSVFRGRYKGQKVAVKVRQLQGLRRNVAELTGRSWEFGAEVARRQCCTASLQTACSLVAQRLLLRRGCRMRSAPSIAVVSNHTALQWMC